MTIQSIRGVHDILPKDNAYWHTIETTIVKLMQQYAYQQIRLPIIEKTQLFKRSIGDVTDIVAKEMYTFTDRNDEQLSLRPEGTAGCVRAGIQHGLLYNQVQKLWYIGPMFRRERPQKGRYRQFNQLGVEAFGLPDPDIDAELILLSSNILQQLQLTDIQLEINTLGSKSARDKYCQALVTYLTKYTHDLDTDSQRRLDTNPLRILDSKNPTTIELLQQAPILTDYLTTEDKQYFASLLQLLDKLNIPYIHNPKLVRGLDYYSQAVFEWTSQQLGAQGTVCAGGRYDDLIQILSNKPGTATGFAIGLERIIELMQQQNVLASETVADIYLAVVSSQATSYSLGIAQQLRTKLPQIKLRQGSASMSLTSQLKQANKFKAAYALIIDDSQVISNTVVCKSLDKKQPQQELDLEKLTNLFKTRYLK